MDQTSSSNNGWGIICFGAFIKFLMINLFLEVFLKRNAFHPILQHSALKFFNPLVDDIGAA